MKKTGIPTRAFLSNVKLFLALSRTTHGLLDLATPAVSALLSCYSWFLSYRGSASLRWSRAFGLALH